jgi:hypothetical protein
LDDGSMVGDRPPRVHAGRTLLLFRYMGEG